jgi:hypothetical protein
MPERTSCSPRTLVGYLALCALTLVVCAVVSGLMRKLGAPERYPLRALRTYAVDPDRNPYGALLSPTAVYTGDFRPILAAARGRLQDSEASLYRSEELEEHSAAFVYTPITALALVPLARTELSVQAAADRVHTFHRVLWAVGALLLYGVLFRGLRPSLGLSALFVLHYLAFYPLAQAVQLTQAGLWIWFGFVLGAFLLQRGHLTLGGIALGLGVSIKPHLVLVPVLLALVRGVPLRFVTASAVTVGVAGVTSIAYAGWADSWKYVTETLPHLSAGYAYFPNQSVNGLLHRLVGVEDPAVFNLALERGWIKAASAVFALAVLVTTTLVLRSTWRPTEEPMAVRNDLAVHRLGIVATAAVLASPVCWMHHFVLLTLPFVTLARRLLRSGARPRALAFGWFVSLALVGWFFDGRHLSGFPWAFLTGLEFYGAVGLLVILLAADVRR